MAVTGAHASAWIFDVQRYSVHDGPGIRTTLFLKGCPLRCAWCQNPESQSVGPEMLRYPELCLSCGECLTACPQRQSGVSGQADPMSVAPECDLCGQCVQVCPTEARRIAGRRVTLDQIVDEVLRDRPFYGAAGGVTLGGGEPLAQWGFAQALAGRLRHEGIHVALDTSACAPNWVIRQVPESIDLAIADLKLVSSAAHQRWTGVDNTQILAALRLWAREMPERLWLSLPLIPGVHNSLELERIAEFVADLDPMPPVRLIPYHRLGEQKYAALGLDPTHFSGDVDQLICDASALLRAAHIEILET